MGKRYRYEDFDDENQFRKIKKSNKKDKHRNKLIDLARTATSKPEDAELLQLEYYMEYKNRK